MSRFEVVGGQSTPGDTYDQFASLDYDRNGSIAQNEWHWSLGSFTKRDLDRNGALSRREFDITGGAAAPSSVAGSQSVRVNSQARWTDAVIEVRAGEVLTFDASGSIRMSEQLSGHRDTRRLHDWPPRT